MVQLVNAPPAASPALTEQPYAPHQPGDAQAVAAQFRDRCGVVVLLERTRAGDVVLDVLSTLQPLDAALDAWTASSLSLALRTTHIAFATWPAPRDDSATRTTHRALRVVAAEVLQQRAAV